VSEDGYYIVDPPNPLPGSLATLLPASQAEKYDAILAKKTFKRYVVRAILGDNIPLAADLDHLVAKPSDSLLHVNEDPLVIHLEYSRYLPFMYELRPTSTGNFSHIDFLVDSNVPVATLSTARRAINALLDVIMRNIWLPLVIVRLDVFEKGDAKPLLHQVILPFSDRLAIGPLGGFGSFAPLAPYEALLREGIAAGSPYYRFMCAFRVLEGIGTLRRTIRELAVRFEVQEKLCKGFRL
jgi:hypothetical protein